MAKRGMIVLNVEWLGMGQLRGAGYRHGVMNQLDLCGASGLAPFYLSMSRGLDILLAHEHADPKRVVVSGLSGGGWQTITISSLDTRVTLANPVAGYSSFLTRIDHFKDLGDSEQTPCDLAKYADYTHLTAMMAPRPTLLTYNSKDDCCFESGYALQPLVDAAKPYFKLANRENSLRTHINDSPGNHNFGEDNRKAYYRMLSDFFFAETSKFNADEIPCAKEVKTKEALDVPLPSNSLDMNTLAKSLIKNLPRNPDLPKTDTDAVAWARAKRQTLKDVLRIRSEFKIDAGFSPRYEPKQFEKVDIKATLRMLKLDQTWTVPVVELVRGEPKGTTLLFGDNGRSAVAA